MAQPASPRTIGNYPRRFCYLNLDWLVQRCSRTYTAPASLRKPRTRKRRWRGGAATHKSLHQSRSTLRMHKEAKRASRGLSREGSFVDGYDTTCRSPKFTTTVSQRDSNNSYMSAFETYANDVSPAVFTAEPP